MRSILLALLASPPGDALVQFHDYDGSLLRELHALAEEHGLTVRVVTGYRPTHEIKIVPFVTLVVHDMNGSWRPTESVGGAWSEAQHCAQGAVS